MTTEDITAFAVTEITTAPTALENGARSPKFVGVILALVRDQDLRAAIETMRTRDEAITNALRNVVALHCNAAGRPNWRAAESNWRDIKEDLGDFEHQVGAQVLVPNMTIGRAIAEGAKMAAEGMKA